MPASQTHYKVTVGLVCGIGLDPECNRKAVRVHQLITVGDLDEAGGAVERGCLACSSIS